MLTCQLPITRIAGAVVLVGSFGTLCAMANAQPTVGLKEGVPADTFSVGDTTRLVEHETGSVATRNPFSTNSLEYDRLGLALQLAKQRTRLLEQEVAAARLHAELERLRSPSAPALAAKDVNAIAPPLSSARSVMQRNATGIPVPPRSRSPMGTPITESPVLPTTHPVTLPQAEADRPLRVLGVSTVMGKQFALVEVNSKIEVMSEGSAHGSIHVDKIDGLDISLNGRTYRVPSGNERRDVAIARQDAQAVTAPVAVLPPIPGLEINRLSNPDASRSGIREAPQWVLPPAPSEARPSVAPPRGQEIGPAGPVSS